MDINCFFGITIAYFVNCFQILTSNPRVVVSTVFASFVIPLVILFFPFLALLLQLCGARKPRLERPHNFVVATGLGLVTSIWFRLIHNDGFKVARWYIFPT
jgi:hypothetical protein